MMKCRGGISTLWTKKIILSAKNKKQRERENKQSKARTINLKNEDSRPTKNWNAQSQGMPSPYSTNEEI